jgi:phospholipid/cholesterol/gamma-HCH transport system permease protein
MHRSTQAPTTDTPITPVTPGALRALEAIGASVQRGLEGLGSATRFTVRAARATADVRTWLPELGAQMLLLGVESLPITAFIALFTGVVLALLASYTLTGAAVPLSFVGTAVEKSVTMELAAVLTGLALAGRVGADIAAEVGTMRVTEQIDALETLAYDPEAYLVVPRVLAGVLTFPILVGLAMVIGVGAGWGASLVLLHMSSADFTKGVRQFFDPFDVRYGVVKAASFGLVVTLAACRRGLRATGGAQGVGQAATEAVVHGAVAILVLDAFWAVTWLLGRAR